MTPEEQKFYDEERKYRYKGVNHIELMETMGWDRDHALMVMAMWRPGHDDNLEPYRLPNGEIDIERQDDELYDYILYFWNMTFPRTCALECRGRCTAPFRIIADAYYARYPLIIVQASRGSAKSASLTTLSVTEMCTMPCMVDVLGASEKQSQITIEYMNNENPRTRGCWWDSPRAPLALKDPKHSLVAEMRLVNGSVLSCLTASPKTVRGRRPTRLRIDELDEAEVRLIKSAQGCPQGDPINKIKKNILMASTHQHVDGTMSFYKELADKQNKKVAKEGKGIKIPVMFFCYRDILTTNGGFLDPVEIEELKATVDEETWDLEFENNEPSTQGRKLRDHQLEFLFDKEFAVKVGLTDSVDGEQLAGEADDPIEIPLEKLFPNPEVEVATGSFRGLMKRQHILDHLEHFAGADYANDVDWSIFTRLTYNPLDTEQEIFYGTGWYRTGRRDKIKDIVHEWNDFVNFHPQTMGAHDETGNKMVNDEIDCDSEPFTFTRISKKEILDNLIKAIQEKKIKLPYIEWAYREFRYLTQDHLTGKKHLPDSVASLALAWYAANQVERGDCACEVIQG